MSRLVADLAARSLLCFGIAAAVASFLRDPVPPAPPTSSCEDTYAQFGAVDRDGDLTVTDVIPLVPGQEFGWRVAVDDTFAHTWREVLITPAAPREWIGSDLVITNDGTVGVTERSEVAVNGVLEHAWTITDGDPAGAHELQLYLDGRLVNTFRFVVR
jgi:hypothetical protein